MTNITSMKISHIEELKRLAWQVGIVYFQLYTEQPDTRFYAALAKSLPHELVVEVPAEQWQVLAEQIGYRGQPPVFGAITGGWIVGLRSDPGGAEELVRGARKLAVLPSQSTPAKRPDETITIEGL